MAKFEINATEMDKIAGGVSRPNLSKELREIIKNLDKTHEDVKIDIYFEPVRA